MALFRGIQEYIARDANNITLVFDSGNILSSRAIYSCIHLKAIQYYIIICEKHVLHLFIRCIEDFHCHGAFQL